MAVSSEFYRDQIAQCAEAAAAATLTNQRDKYLQARAAWQALADREVLNEASRAKCEADRAIQLP